MKKVFITVDLGNGDSGKGNVVASLTEQFNVHTVVRYNGAAQAAHNVVTPDGRHHTFSQFGSGTFTPGVATYLSEHVLVAPSAFLNEATYLETVGVTDALTRAYINENSPIITPFHKQMNQMKERARGKNRHGSCGMGIGETMMDVVRGDERFIIRAKDLNNISVLRDKLENIHYLKYTEAKSSDDTDVFLDYQEITGLWYDNKPFWKKWVSDCQTLTERANIVNGEVYERELFSRDGVVVFEGSQGVLLDEWHGLHPYTTWSTTTSNNAEDILTRNDYDGEVTTIGILRPYATRHGAGPLPTESKILTQLLSEEHNTLNDWQGEFRFGFFDTILSRYAVECCQLVGEIDVLAITHLDELEQMKEWGVCVAYSNNYSYITSLPVNTKNDLDAQEKLQKMVSDVSAHIVFLDNNADAVCQAISDELSIPVLMSLWGPEYVDNAFETCHNTDFELLRQKELVG